MQPIGVDLFSGAGGLSLGFESAGFHVAAAVEHDPVHCATYEFNFPYSTPICRSVVDISGADIRRAAGIGTREIAVVFGGPPCQGFSMIGKRVLEDPRNTLMHDFVRLVVDLQPALFALENVKGLALGEHRGVLEDVIASFEKSGYRVHLPYQILDAADYGVPQRRHRLFLLGARRDRQLPDYPRPAQERVLVADAIGDLPDADCYPELTKRDWTRVDFGTSSLYARRLRQLASDPDDLGSRRAFNQSLLTSSLRTAHKVGSRRRFAATRHGDTEPISRFHKLDPCGVSSTIRSGTGSDRGSFTSPRPIHPYAPRCITNREAARLHSYPDWFRFHVTKWHGFRQIGNSVPPLLARAVAKSLMAALGEEPEVARAEVVLGETSLLRLTTTQAAVRYRED